MKTSIIIAYGLIVVLAIVAIMQWRMINKLTPIAVKDSSHSDSSANTNGSASFGDMIAKLKESNVQSLNLTF